MRPRIAIGMLTLLLGHWTAAQSDCDEKLHRALEAVRRHIEQAPQQALDADLDITTVPADGAVSTERIHRASGAERTMTTNTHFTVFEDSRTRVVIMHDDKLIYLYDQLPGKDNLTITGASEILEVLLHASDVVHCEERVSAGDTLLNIEIQLHDPSKYQHIRKAVFTIDIGRGNMRSATVEYGPGAPLKSQRMDCRSYALGRLNEHLQKAAIAQVLSGKDPLPPYRDHRFIDLRKRPTRHADR